jgi:hypothetical protein
LRVVLRLFAAVAGFAALLRAAGFFAAGFFAALFLAAGFFALERLAADFGFAAERLGVAAVAGAASSPGHLPDITFCAASATASAISEPSLVALDITDLAALSAVSAASIPASLMALRAFGLAAIAAAAAVRPAASISLLIAALAILSVVLEPELFERDEDLDEAFRVLDFAIANLPCGRRIYTWREQQFRCAAEKAKEIGGPGCVKGSRHLGNGSLEHGQRPEMWPSVSTTA